MTTKVDKDILARLEKLEQAVFGNQAKKPLNRNKTKQLKGPKGGILLLISKGFFTKPIKAVEVRSKLESEGYYYSIAPVQTALNRLATVSGPLTRHEKDGKKVYVGRK